MRRTDKPDLATRVDGAAHILVGRIVEAGLFRFVRRRIRGRAIEAGYSYWIVEAGDFLKGDPAQVLPGYRKRFPIYTLAFEEGRILRPFDQRFPRTEAPLEKGRPLVLLVRLPSRETGTSEWEDAPRPLKRKFGKYDVDLIDALPLGARAEVEKTILEVAEARRREIEQARAITLRDRFVRLAAQRTGGKPPDAAALDAIAGQVARFVQDEFRKIRKIDVTALRVKDRLPEGVDRWHVFVLSNARTGEKLGTLRVATRIADGSVGAWVADGPVLREECPNILSPLDPAVRRRVRRRVEMRLKPDLAGGVLEPEIQGAQRGDGLSLVMFHYRLGRLGSARAYSPARYWNVELTCRTHLIFSYSNGWRQAY